MSFLKSQNKQSLIKLTIASIALITIFGGGYFAYQKFSKKSDTASTIEKTAEKKGSGIDPNKNVSEVKDVEEVVAKWIENNPQAILESVQNMYKKAQEEQLKNAQKNISAKKDELFNSKVSGEHAPAGYDVSIVEFYDYNCGYCKKAQASVEDLIKSDSKVRIIYREFPILGPDSLEMAKVSVAVNIINPKAFKSFHDELMKTKEKGKSAALKAAKSAGINVAELEKTISSKKDEIEKIINSSIELGSSIGISGTPGFIIGEELIPGAIEKSSLQEKIKTIREKKA
jgi:protein-disulfide isomerase